MPEKRIQHDRSSNQDFYKIQPWDEPQISPAGDPVTLLSYIRTWTFDRFQTGDKDPKKTVHQSRRGKDIALIGYENGDRSVNPNIPDSTGEGIYGGRAGRIHYNQLWRNICRETARQRTPSHDYFTGIYGAKQTKRPTRITSW